MAALGQSPQLQGRTATDARWAARYWIAALAITCSCAQVPTRATEPLPIVEIQVADTPEQTDDYVGFSAVPCRARITNVEGGCNRRTFASDIPVTLVAFHASDGGDLLFSTSSTLGGVASLDVNLPADGSWVDFFATGKSDSPSRVDKDVAIQVLENRPGHDGVVLARHALMVTESRPTASNATAVEIQIAQSPASIDDYLTWSPTPARIRRVHSGAAETVTLRSMPATGATLQFAAAGSLSPHDGTATTPSLAVSLPADGSWAEFYVAGTFGSPSIRDKDAVIEAVEGSDVLARQGVMVRIRKDANTLTAEERDRFLSAVAALNTTFGRYAVHQQIHNLGVSQAHGGPGFLPWHRVFVLELERELQGVDPSVTIPYWRFDVPAPNVFSSDFMGGPPSTGSTNVTLSMTNPLLSWTIDALHGIDRTPTFLPTNAPSLLSETETLALGSGSFSGFADLEGDPHGLAHTKSGGGGWLGDITIAVRDPLFFLLHCNVDRLWAKWQLAFDRWDPVSADAYSPQGEFPNSPSATARKGHYAGDTMWPWDEVTGTGNDGADISDRPASAPGGKVPQILGFVLSPPAAPRPMDVIDYRSNRLFTSANSGLGFAYDDVPY